MKILIKVQTQYQLIIALQIKNTILKNECVDIVLSSKILNGDCLKKRIEEIGIFNNCYYSYDKDFYEARSKKKKITDIVAIAYKQTSDYLSILNLRELFESKYDSFWSYNWDIVDTIIAVELEKNNRNIEYVRFEEGLISHNSDPRVRGRIKWLTKINNEMDICKKVNDFYCMMPELATERNYSKHRIPRINRENKEFISILNYVFNYDPTKSRIYEKNIYFTSATDIDEAKVGELDLIDSIFRDKEDLVIKVHPRESSEPYLKSGYRVMESNNMPWEIIHLNHEMDNKAFFTVLSGSVLNSIIMTGDKTKVAFLWPLIKDKNEWVNEWCERYLRGLINRLDECNKVSHTVICCDRKALSSIL